MHPLAEKYLRKTSLPSIYCPGCGHGTVLNAFLRAVDDLGIMDDIGLVGGIGCSSWTPVFVNTDVLHTLHGRAIAMATGLKLANPKRHVVVFTGDGDVMWWCLPVTETASASAATTFSTAPGEISILP